MSNLLPYYSAKSSVVMTGQELKGAGVKSSQVWHDIRWIQMASKPMTITANKAGRGRGPVLYLKVESNVFCLQERLVGSVMEATYCSWGEHKTSGALIKDPFVPKTFMFTSTSKWYWCPHAPVPWCPSGVQENSPAAFSFRIAHLEVSAHGMNVHMTNQPLWMKRAPADQ